ncbi:DUF4374 domain-containing protein [Mesonia sp.]|uniref:DUF4374 domain-containing protein n=1 Tax=Mesonia sp. TaxID=1960830 RepID=UPI0017724AD9|nr:DUF4374 domain-containing protein [Mesonia sp.]HIB36656.1 DUF4374 domain-containing protein [Mesonia sp.]HIO27415.1 DUF4374 domain-containing protein [Flavobacteriaceae bacterium]
MNKSIFNFSKALTLSALSLLFVFSTVSCSSDDDAGENPTGEDPEAYNPYALSLAIQSTDGSYSYYTVAYDDVMSGTLTAQGQGIEQPGYYDFTMINNTIYSLGGLDDVNVVAINADQDSQSLTQTGDVSFPNSLSDLVEADDNTLVSVTMSSDSDIITFRKFNPNTVEVSETKEIQVAELTNLVGTSYSGMVVSGDHLFLSYYISDPETFATTHTDQAEVAVFSYPELEFQEVITDDRVGPIGGFNTKSGLVKDAAGNVYAISHSNPANGYSQSTKPAGILKINAGETTFDEDYFFDINEIAGGNMVYAKLLSNGQFFTEINTESRATQAMWSDNPLESAIVDFEAQTVNYVQNIPAHGGDGRRLVGFEEDNNYYITIPEEDGIFVYQIDTQNYTATQGAEVQASFIAGFYKF